MGWSKEGQWGKMKEGWRKETEGRENDTKGREDLDDRNHYYVHYGGDGRRG